MIGCVILYTKEGDDVKTSGMQGFVELLEPNLFTLRIHRLLEVSEVMFKPVFPRIQLNQDFFILRLIRESLRNPRSLHVKTAKK